MIEAEGGEFLVNKQAAGSIGKDNLNTINKGKLPQTSVNQQVVQNNKAMEDKLDGVIAGLDMVANKTGNVRAYVVDSPNAVPDMTDYSRDYQSSAIGGEASSRIGFA